MNALSLSLLIPGLCRDVLHILLFISKPIEDPDGGDGDRLDF